MNNNFSKLLFLGILMAVAVMAGRGMNYGGPAQALERVTASAGANPPLVVLEPPALVGDAASPGVVTPVNATSSSAQELNSLVSQILPQLGLNEASSSSAASVPSSDYSSGGAPPAVSETADGTSGFNRTGFDAPPVIGAHSAVVADLLGGETFFLLRPADRWPTASLAKLITSAVVSDNMDLSQTFTVENSSGTIKAGDRYGGSDLLRAMLMLSSNEATQAFADAYGEDKFTALMNAYVKDWGLTDTYFDEPTGLSSTDESTTYDLMKIARRVYDNYPAILKITRTPSVYITELNHNKKILVKNINQFAGEAGFLGGKTGYTDDALGNLLSLFYYERRPVLTIVLGSDDRFGDTQKLLEWFENNYR